MCLQHAPSESMDVEDAAPEYDSDAYSPQDQVSIWILCVHAATKYIAHKADLVLILGSVLGAWASNHFFIETHHQSSFCTR